MTTATTPASTKPDFSHRLDRSSWSSSRLLLCAALLALLATTLFTCPARITGLIRSSSSRLFAQRPASTPLSSIARSATFTMPEAERKVSPREEKEWNHLAEGMDYYHQHFRQNFNAIYEAGLPASLCKGRLADSYATRSLRTASLRSKACRSRRSCAPPRAWPSISTCTTILWVPTPRYTVEQIIS